MRRDDRAADDPTKIRRLRSAWYVLGVLTTADVARSETLRNWCVCLRLRIDRLLDDGDHRGRG